MLDEELFDLREVLANKRFVGSDHILAGPDGAEDNFFGLCHATLTMHRR